MHDLILTHERLDGVISAWLDEKFYRSGSAKTRKAYCDTLSQFRSTLARGGLDLDNVEYIPPAAQAFSRFSAIGRLVASATINQRLAIISSFYSYAIRQGLLASNPINLVGRSKVQAYASAAPIHADQTMQALASIDRTKMSGKRDYALLAILLSTGRRASEVCGLTLADIERQKGRTIITFRHCKGGKIMRDCLPPPTAEALDEWIQASSGEDAPGDRRPVWTVLKTSGCKGRKVEKGDQLTEQSLADICQKHLGTSKVHATRHTWAYQMEKAGAKVSFIQAKLGHESLATTGRYLAALTSDENEYAATIAANMGIVGKNKATVR